MNRLQLTLVLLVLLVVPLEAGAKPLNSRVYKPTKLIVFPIGPQHRNNLSLIFPTTLNKTADTMSDWIYEEYLEITKSLGQPVGIQTQIRLMEAKKFYRETQLPTWTNAIYLENQIVIPIDLSKTPNEQETKRAIRHELVHAVVDHLTQGKCPGWLDEGLAQLLEGPEHPALLRALKKWVSHSGAIPFDVLQTGFTKLSRPMVPAAYAQSYLAATILSKESGYGSFQVLFRKLKSGNDFESSFSFAFGESVGTFEERLKKHLIRLGFPQKTSPKYVVVNNEVISTSSEKKVSKTHQTTSARATIESY